MKHSGSQRVGTYRKKHSGGEGRCGKKHSGGEAGAARNIAERRQVRQET